MQRPNRLAGASVANLAEWQARTFPTMAPRATPWHDELPVDLFADPAATQATFSRARRGRAEDR